MPDSVWGTNPVFMLENNNYYFYHNDALGTPQKMTDINGNVVWSATYTSFGEATVDAGSTITNNLRFAGQYFDEETGKHYNWNRYYDPKTGRYTQVDPIGLYAGDANFYRYVFNSSVNFIDPLGLYGSCLSGRDDQPIPLGCQIRARMEMRESGPDWVKSLLVDILGPIGTFKGLLEVASGEDLISGEPLGNWRWTGLLVGASYIKNIRHIRNVKLLNKLAKNAKKICKIREQYEKEVRALKDLAEKLLAEGKSTEEVARTLYAERNALKMKYRALSPIDDVQKFEQRNLNKYGDKLSLSIEEYRASGKSWEDIIDSAARPGGKDLGF